MFRGIDIYNGDGRPDFAAVKASGIDYIIHKATEGVNCADASFAVNVTAARAAGLLVGAYHFLRATPIDQQAADFLAAIKDHGPYTCLAIDVEDATPGNVSSLGKEAITDRILTIYRAIRAAGYSCPVYAYASASWLRSLIDTDACRAAGLKIWMAAYSSDTPDSTDHADICDMWQYSDNGSVPGISRGVDMDVCYGGLGATTAQAPAQTAPAKSGSATVRTIQQRLNSMRVASLAVDGISGPKTQAAIKSFQGICGLSADGMWGANTEAAYQSIAARPTLRVGSNGTAVRYVQSRVGTSVDGIFGNGTRSAAQLWQRRNGLAADGIVGANTWAKLIG